MQLVDRVYPTVVVAAVALSATLAAFPQQPPVDRSSGEALDRPIPMNAFSVPIHTAEADKGLEYGIWASGPDYKVSFHDGMAFYPMLGKDAPRNLPVRWVTTSVRVGDRELLQDAPRTAYTDWRFEFQHDEFTEAYDVRADGVEQTFVLHRRPDAVGDLVIRGRLDTELRADRLPAQVSDLELRDDRGNAVVRYGRALAFDDSGATRDVSTQYDGDAVELRLSQEFLANATYPLTVDPLLSNAMVSPGGGTIWGVSIGRNDSHDELMVAFLREFSSGDEDVYVHLLKDNWAFTTPIFTDVSTQWGHRSIDVAYVAGAKRWVVAYNRTFQFSSSEMRVHYHDGGDFSMSTVLQFLTNADFADDIAVGGATDPSSVEALIVYRKDVGQINGPNSAVRGFIVDAATYSKLSDFQISNQSTIHDAEACQVVERRQLGSVPWLVTFHESERIYNPGDDWDLYVTRVWDDGRRDRVVEIGDSNIVNHSVRPFIDGGHDRAIVAYHGLLNTTPGPAPTFTRQIMVQRVDWSLSANWPVVTSPEEIIRSSEFLAIGGIAYDNQTRSHWTVVVAQVSGPSQIEVLRLGHDSRVAESATISGGTGYQWTAVTFDDDAKEYSIAFHSGGNVLGTKLAYPQGAGTTYIGTACGSATISPRGTSHAYLPWSGTSNFGVALYGAPTATSAVLMLAGGTSSIPLGTLGLPGCTVYLDPAQLAGSIAVQLTSSFYDLPMKIPSGPTGDIYMQWVYLNPGAVGGIELTRGMSVAVR